MSFFDRALQQVDDGIQGNNTGIPIPFPRLRQYLPNIQQKTYYLIGAGTKIGKTSFADDTFFYGAFDYYKSLKDHDLLNGFELDIDYYSYEIDIDTKIIKGINRKLWHDYGIITDSNTILSKGPNHCKQELYDLILTFREYFDDLEEICTIHDMPDNPTGMKRYLVDKAKTKGETILKNINQDPEGTPIMRFDSYVPYNRKRYWLIFIDHIALMLEERGFNTKQNIDKMSQYLVGIRNNYRATPIVIQQLSFDTDNDERHKSGRLVPTKKDFGDSKYTTRDANVIMTLFNPYEHQLDKFKNYDIRTLGNSFRNLEILANRDGEPNINLGLNFIGPCGTFRELPKAIEMNPDSYKYMASLENGESVYYKDSNGLWVLRP